jgi:short-subunit dehydrogenase
MRKHGTILITGATDGIGLALARHVHDAGRRLALVGRCPVEGLPDFFTARNYCAADLKDPDSPRTIEQFLETEAVDDLDTVVHNAATGYHGPVEDQSEDSLAEMLQVNVASPIELTRRLLPRLRSGGTIVFVSSVAAALPCPEYATYAASKAALEGFARSLRVELLGRFEVIVVRPGATRTGFHEKIGLDPERIGWSRLPPPEKVADAILRAISRRRRRAVVGLGNRILCAAWHYLAGPLDRWQRGRVQ